MKTIYITIGNCDNKLTQREWHDFCRDLETYGNVVADAWHFRGYSPSESLFQTMCICIAVSDASLPYIRGALGIMANDYRQDSIALAIADVELVRA